MRQTLPDRWSPVATHGVLLDYSVAEMMGAKLNGKTLRMRAFPQPVRCAWGPRDGMKRHRECVFGSELDMATLVWTRGRGFPLGLLESRLRCPRCGSRRVRVTFTVPALPARARAL